MTDMTTGPAGPGRHSDDDKGSGRTVAPTPSEATEDETTTGTTTGKGTGARTGASITPEEAADRGTGRPVAPTPPEAADGPTGRTGTAGTPTATGQGSTGRTITPTPPEVTEEAATSGSGPGTGTHSATRDGSRPVARLLPHDECDKLELRLRNAVSGFVDGPQDAVREADQVVEEIAGRFAEAVTRRRRALRTSWQDGNRSAPEHPDTEQLRLALRDYRELAERLLHS
ncbi:hypothetical protein [Streptomyces cylindrosporus]|uniref:Uncharacterized protein n=1 Tax=Streptomyces cylindrosporus TaxID=2927583 RepID=A0ABS9XZ43_9ACTN|nr:hypothetical protein [Streptomyces cylindrosporus]MCI3270029.1 hypothetical protein [Streptomyces cylindrosporus]